MFKQKTAYEMRISDWSSDVCSSDLVGGGGAQRGELGQRRLQAQPHLHDLQHVGDLGQLLQVVLRPVRLRADEGAGAMAAPDAALRFQHLERAAHRPAADADLLGELRSEEHTSELQSLMRITYAVYCLNK